MASPSKSQVARLEALLEGYEQRLAKLDKLLDGNGQPGLRDRLTRLETLADTMLKAQESISGAVSEVTVKVGQLADSLTLHSKDKTRHGLSALLSWRALAAAFGVITGFLGLLLVVHQIIHSSPTAEALFERLLGL